MWKSAADWDKVRTHKEELLFNEELYNHQLDNIHDYVLLGNVKQPKVNQVFVGGDTHFKLIYRGEVFAGSRMAHELSNSIPFDDTDIYFHSKEHAAEFLAANRANLNIVRQLDRCAYGHFMGFKVNLIWGYDYVDPADLIAKFDIRACAVAYDPTTQICHWVDGAVADGYHKYIVWQPSCRHATIKRMVKYMTKGFKSSSYQKAILAELIKAGIHSTEVELTEGAGYEP